MTPPTATATKVPNYVNGRWVESSSKELRDVINPASGEVIASVPMSDEAEVLAAIQAAHAAFPAWRRTPAEDRIQPLFKLKMLVEEHIDDLARTNTKENGKTCTEAKAELRRSIENVEVACGIPMMMQGYNLEDVARGIDEFMIRQPLGVVAAITAFNFPGMIPFWFLRYAIACGNTLIVKPSERVPLTMKLAFELLEQCGLPPGVANIVNGGRSVVDMLFDHPDKATVLVDLCEGGGKNNGAKFCVAGRNPSLPRCDPGSLDRQRFVEGAPATSELTHTEIFGPVLSMVHAKDLDEAMDLLAQ